MTSAQPAFETIVLGGLFQSYYGNVRFHRASLIKRAVSPAETVALQSWLQRQFPYA